MYSYVYKHVSLRMWGVFSKRLADLNLPLHDQDQADDDDSGGDPLSDAEYNSSSSEVNEDQ